MPSDIGHGGRPHRSPRLADLLWQGADVTTRGLRCSKLCFEAAGILAKPAPQVDLDEFVRLREAGWSYPRLAERYGLSNDAVRTRYLRAKGLPLRGAEAERRGIPWRP